MDPPAHFHLCVAKLLEIVKHNKPLHPQAVSDKAQRVANATWLWPIIFRHGTRDNEARPFIRVGNCCIQHFAADIVEVDINAVRAGGLDSLFQIGSVFVIKAGIKAEFFGDIITLVFRSGDADNFAAFHFGNLPGCRADRPCG